MGRPKSPRNLTKMPALFSTSEATEFLVLLSVNEPVDIVEMSALMGSPNPGLYRIAKRLTAQGLIKRHKAQGTSWSHLSKPYTLNTNHPAADELRDLLQSLARAYKVRGLWRRGDCAISQMSTKKVKYKSDRTFGQRKRTHALILICAVGVADGTLLFGSAANVTTSITLRDIAKYGIIKGTQIGRHRVYALADSFPAADELKAFLTKLLSVFPIFQGLASAIEFKRRADPTRAKQIRFILEKDIRDIDFGSSAVSTRKRLDDLTLRPHNSDIHNISD